MNYVKTIILVVVLLVIGYFLLPYVKLKPKSTPSNNNNNSSNSNNNQNSNSGTSSSNGSIQTFSSDNLGISFKYDSDQDGDGKADTSAQQMNDKVYVYYTASPVDQGQWVQEFKKDPSTSLHDAITADFLKNYSSQDCFVQTLQDYYKSYDADAPAIPSNADEAVIAYPQTMDPNLPYWQNADKCPATYTVANGISYFYMDKSLPDKYFFFSIGQYGILADPATQQSWQDTFQVK